ncbi:MAG: 2-succinyl-6-hydroxy-2,4-cyclohexadiene-1-carboxylate synthase [Candidatus Hydrogenedentes bacterium]|nr:2-succinyl-6-hydroxy-2,4-cyclohexadiene-1-carboxylate synthase [Candidatus Hydrogenedentota bacterium]
MLDYALTGNPAGPAILFLHGFLGAHDDWDEVVQRLAPVYRCVTIDLPGHGRSVGASCLDDYGMVATADAVIEVADEAGLDHFSVVGYSMGGRIALYLATVFAMRLDCLVLESASPGLKSTAEREARRARDAAWAETFESEELLIALEKWYGQPIFEQIKTDPVRFDAMLRRRLTNGPREVARALRALGTGSQSPLWNELAFHTMPTLLVVGEHDAKFRAIAEEMTQRCPAMRLGMVPGCGHNVHFEKPQEYTELLQCFIPSA